MRGHRQKGRRSFRAEIQADTGLPVIGVAAGNGTASRGIYRGVAPRSGLLVVNSGSPEEDGFPRTTELMRAVDYVIKLAYANRMPLAVNLSFGNAYGSHSGDSLIETYLDAASGVGRNVISVGTGNDAALGGHYIRAVSGGHRAGCSAGDRYIREGAQCSDLETI